MVWSPEGYTRPTTLPEGNYRKNFTLFPLYIDLRRVRRYPLVKTIVVDVFQDIVRLIDFDLLADVPTAATPLVSSLSDRLNIGMITPRIEIKGHGNTAKVDGFSDNDLGKTAVLLDDLITTADSKLEAIDILREVGIKVKDIVVLIDREQGGREQLLSRGINLHTALPMSKMLGFYLKSGYLNIDHYQDIYQKLNLLNHFLGII